jgi:DNA mismatch endonuclease (patch repair protein)
LVRIPGLIDDVMVDIVSKEKRSEMMAGIRSRDTKPEILTRSALHKMGYRYRHGAKIGKVKPDIVLPKYGVAIFVHGCYWHQHNGCKFAYSDRNYSEKWLRKFSDNKARDKRVLDLLIKDGWRVAVVWECVTRDSGRFEEMIKNLDHWIREETSNHIEFG